jgi:hypothetical protein
MSERGIKPNDTVLHRPSGETWVVAGVNHGTGQLIPFGYPFPSIGKIVDCELLEKGYEREPQSEKTIRALMARGLDNFVDVTSAMLHGII